jgi:tetratricopeptide (TPR) repeat protein
MDAWAAYPFAPDPSIGFYEPIFRAGEMTARELTEKREEWLAREERRASEGRTARERWTVWATIYGSFAETREEAVLALRSAPRDEAIPGPGRRSLFLDFALGKVYALTSRWDEAIAHLERVVMTCTTFDDVMVVTKARLFLAQAHEAKGETASAKAIYEKIVETWPKNAPSRTLKRATDRLAAMARD